MIFNMCSGFLHVSIAKNTVRTFSNINISLFRWNGRNQMWSLKIDLTSILTHLSFSTEYVLFHDSLTIHSFTMVTFVYMSCNFWITSLNFHIFQVLWDNKAGRSDYCLSGNVAAKIGWLRSSGALQWMCREASSLQKIECSSKKYIQVTRSNETSGTGLCNCVSWINAVGHWYTSFWSKYRTKSIN